MSQADLRKLVGRDDETLRLWRQDGCPHQMVNGRPRYVGAKVVAWLEERAARRALPVDYEEAKGRKMAAEAESAELDLAVKKKTLMPIALHGERLARILERIRARFLAIPGRLAPRLVGLDHAGEASALLAEEIALAMADLSGAGR